MVPSCWVPRRAPRGKSRRRGRIHCMEARQREPPPVRRKWDDRPLGCGCNRPLSGPRSPMPRAVRGSAVHAIPANFSRAILHLLARYMTRPSGPVGLHRMLYRKPNAERGADTSRMLSQKPGFRLKSTRRLAEQRPPQSFFSFFSSQRPIVPQGLLSRLPEARAESARKYRPMTFRLARWPRQSSGYFAASRFAIMFEPRVRFRRFRRQTL